MAVTGPEPLGAGEGGPSPEGDGARRADEVLKSLAGLGNLAVPPTQVCERSPGSHSIPLERDALAGFGTAQFSPVAFGGCPGCVVPELRLLGSSRRGVARSRHRRLVVRGDLPYRSQFRSVGTALLRVGHMAIGAHAAEQFARTCMRGCHSRERQREQDAKHGLSIAGTLRNDCQANGRSRAGNVVHGVGPGSRARPCGSWRWSTAASALRSAHNVYYVHYGVSGRRPGKHRSMNHSPAAPTDPTAATDLATRNPSRPCVVSGAASDRKAERECSGALAHDDPR